MSFAPEPIALIRTDPGSLTALAGAGLAYALGARRWSQQAGRPMVSRRQRASFLLGLVATAAAVASPLDTLADHSLSWHMTQHVVLLSLSGPLFALGAPVPTLIWALPARARSRALRTTRRMTRSHDRWQAGWVAGGLVLEAVAVLGWHLPPLYEAAIHNTAVHGLEHLTFVVTATASWWTVVTGRRSRRGAAAVAALVGSMTGIILGSAMVIAPNPFYPTYARGTVAGALSDQRMAGVVMWAFGGLLDDIAGAALFASWLAMSHERPDEAYVVPPLRGAPS